MRSRPRGAGPAPSGPASSASAIGCIRSSPLAVRDSAIYGAVVQQGQQHVESPAPSRSWQAQAAGKHVLGGGLHVADDDGGFFAARQVMDVAPIVGRERPCPSVRWPPCRRDARRTARTSRSRARFYNRFFRKTSESSRLRLKVFLRRKDRDVVVEPKRRRRRGAGRTRSCVLRRRPVDAIGLESGD